MECALARTHSSTEKKKKKKKKNECDRPGPVQFFSALTLTFRVYGFIILGKMFIGTKIIYVPSTKKT